MLLLGVNSLIAASDPILTLAEELSKSHTWENGTFPIIHLPETAKPEEIVAAYFAATTDPKGKIKDFEIQDTQQVKITGSLPDNYTAVWCGTDFGGRIILMQFKSPDIGWWTRCYFTRYFMQDIK